MNHTVRKEHIIRALSFMENFEGISLLQVEETLLRESKDKRKTLSSEDVYSKGYDVYKKRNTPAKQVIQSLLDTGFIEPISASFENEKYQLTSNGHIHLERSLTHDFSPAFITFKQEVDSRLTGLGIPKLSPVHLMKYYYFEKSIDYIVKHHGEWSQFSIDICDYQKDILRQLGFSNEDIESSPIFLLSPKLFLPRHLLDADIQLEIEGIDIQGSICLSKPYPNKRYVVAENRSCSVKNTIGFFSMLNPLNESNNHKEIVLKWTVNNLLIVHHLDITFALTNEIGNLFSNNQKFIRKSIQKSFQSTTYLPTNLSFYRNRNVKIETKGRDIKITERLLVEAFPFENNGGIVGDKNYKKYINNRNAELKI